MRKPDLSAPEASLFTMSPDFLVIFRVAPTPMLVVRLDDPQFSVVDANSAYLRLSGMNLEQVVGRGIFDLFPPNHHDSASTGPANLISSFRRVIATRTPDLIPALRYDVNFNRAGFHEHFWKVHNAPLPGPDGSVQFILHSVEELPGEVGAELKRQWHLFDSVLSHIPDFAYTFDLEGRFTYINEALLNLWQKPLRDCVGKNFFELGYPQDLAARLQRQIKAVIDTNGPVRDQTPFTGPTGETRHYEYIFVPVLAEDGHVEAVAGSTRDITEREQLALEREANQKKLEQLFAQAPVAIAVLRGRDFIIELANPTYRALLHEREIIGKRFVEIVPELGQDVWDAFNTVLETGEPFMANEWLVPYDRDGDGVSEDHWFNVVYNPRRDDDGVVSGIIAVLANVTEQVLARKQLERANRELEEFAFVASHDLQEPLRMVSIYTELVLDGVRSGEPFLEEYGGFVRDGVRRLEDLIRDLLVFSRVAHEDESPVRRGDLSASLTEALAVLKNRIEETSAEITASPLPFVRGDSSQLAHVFQNILSNALKYRKPGSRPIIDISAQREGMFSIISIKDAGIGFDPQYADRIFGLFKRLHKHEYPGTGLGLAICKRIVERYEGRIWAESKPGDGSTFSFSLVTSED
jgi:PAS domain S-box-containing protein